MTTTITNDFHRTETTIRANVGDRVSRSTLRRVWRRLCGITECTCGGDDGSRHSDYSLVLTGYAPTATAVVVDNHKR